MSNNKYFHPPTINKYFVQFNFSTKSPQTLTESIDACEDVLKYCTRAFIIRFSLQSFFSHQIKQRTLFVCKFSLRLFF